MLISYDTAILAGADDGNAAGAADMAMRALENGEVVFKMPRAPMTPRSKMKLDIVPVRRYSAGSGRRRSLVEVVTLETNDELAYAAQEGMETLGGRKEDQLKRKLSERSLKRVMSSVYDREGVEQKIKGRLSKSKEMQRFEEHAQANVTKLQDAMQGDDGKRQKQGLSRPLSFMREQRGSFDKATGVDQTAPQQSRNSTPRSSLVTIEDDPTSKDSARSGSSNGRSSSAAVYSPAAAAVATAAAASRLVSPRDPTRRKRRASMSSSVFERVKETIVQENEEKDVNRNVDPVLTLTFLRTKSMARAEVEKMVAGVEAALHIKKNSAAHENRAIVRIQSIIRTRRAHRAKRRAMQRLEACLTIQCTLRMHLAMRVLKFMRRSEARHHKYAKSHQVRFLLFPNSVM